MLTKVKTLRAAGRSWTFGLGRINTSAGNLLGISTYYICLFERGVLVVCLIPSSSDLFRRISADIACPVCALTNEFRSFEYVHVIIRTKPGVLKKCAKCQARKLKVGSYPRCQVSETTFLRIITAQPSCLREWRFCITRQIARRHAVFYFYYYCT